MGLCLKTKNTFPLFDLTGDLFAVVGADGKVIEFSSRWTAVLGWTTDELRALNWLELIQPLDADMPSATARSSGKATRFQRRVAHKDGSWRLLSWSVIHDPEQGTHSCIARDLTEVRRDRKLFEQVQKLARVGAWEYDLSNRQIYWTSEVYGLLEADILTFKPDDDNRRTFYPEESWKRLEAAFSEALEQRRGFEVEVEMITATGRRFWARTTGQFDFGARVRAYGTIQDISESRHSELRRK